MKKSMLQRPAAGPETGLSLFLIMYVLGLAGVLLGIHVLQPEREDARGASRSDASRLELTGTPTTVPRAAAGILPR